MKIVDLGDGMFWEWRYRSFVEEPSVRVVDAFTVTLPGTPPSQNERERMHWRVRSDSDTSWKDMTVTLFRQAIARSGVTPAELDAPWLAADIGFTFQFARPNRRDIANFIGGAKPIVDALLVPGPLSLLKDDSYIYLDSVTARVQRRLEKQPSTIVRIARCQH